MDWRCRKRSGCQRSAPSTAIRSSITTNGCATRNRRMCATMWRRRTATANSAWHRSHRCAKRCSRNSNRMCRKPTCPCRRAWMATGTSPAPSRANSMPCNAGCRFAARTIGIRRRWRRMRRSTANRWCSIRTSKRKGTISSVSVAWIFPRMAVGCCTAPTREATNGTISASAILRPATSWRNGSRASAAPASRRTRNGCSTCCSTAHGVRTR